jgi:hypothetical protein
MSARQAAEARIVELEARLQALERHQPSPLTDAQS